MLRILLTRHAQSEWNAVGKWQGQADPPLSDLGRRQAYDASQRVGTVDAIVASTLERAHHTALVISEQIGVGPVLLVEGLIERDAGEWSGLTRTDIEREWPGYLDSGQRPPGYEGDESLLERTLESLVAIHDEVVGDRGEGAEGPAEALVVAHGGVIYTVEAHLGFDFARVPNLGGRWITIDGDGQLTAGDRVLLLDPDEATVQAPDIV